MTVRRRIEGPLPSGPSSVCAVVVTYFPDHDIQARIEKLLAQVGKIVVVDNGSSEESFTSRSDLEKIDAITVVAWPDNRGIAAALNEGIREARAMGFDWVLTMDQDSTLAPDAVEEMLEAYRSEGNAMGVAMLGPYYEAPNLLQIPTIGGTPCTSKITSVLAIITSGTLMPTSLLDMVGPFREELFIDNVDIEFCWRVRRAGFLVGVAHQAKMEHHLGTLEHLGSFGYASHPPIRTYYRTRNFIWLLRETFWQDPHFFRDRLLKFVLFSVKAILLLRPKWSHLALYWQGIVDGVFGRMESH